MKRHLPDASPPARPRPGFPAKLAPSVQPVVGKSLGASAFKPASSVGAEPAGAKPPQASVQRPVVTIGHGPDLQAVRAAMVRKLQAQGLAHPAVLAALQTVERHRFVDSALASQAYEDTSLPIGLGQTISKPNVVARMLELMCHGRTEKLGRVLEIGTGCGYQAALLSHLSHEVYSIERLRGLHTRARENLRWFRLSNLHLLLGDGMLGYAQGAPYAAIIAAAGGNDIPQAWIDQLAVGGRLVAPAMAESGRQHLVVIDKTTTGVVRTVLETVLFVPLKSGVA
ncbi:MAG: protein-L-isoaspartate(D-aspartate) O-methyltransferase [Hydrogenophaga sp.]|jgi:protein-L-isoaspartate(D-aspartate) O-methyltransferase|uniref:protein-L-isoaspartate(D-aspartate) O-methyltransferase n=1 Tax=Hydrogenophaga sp. TaxID=1904254 RepID=UPI002719A55B|nr:protein-L-isoaspartate(D-aspartate) O-methyltransferase [Hydrogenophaga sp.]MDO9569112.1 protein-L-isoaspartate(D-aspartate) O-methyltransferase [Hydrogenophaga sp.]